MDREGLVVIRDLLSKQEAVSGLTAVKEVLADARRENSSFASSTDIANKRREFCPLPANGAVMGLASTLTQRLASVLLEYCGRSRPVLEVSALVSHIGSSHQYIHRDPPNVITVFTALEDVGETQGGTVFVPRSHEYPGAEKEFDGKARTLMWVFQTMSNWQIFKRNLAMIFRLRRGSGPILTGKEFWERVCSTKSDRHQPNIVRFLLGRNYLFDIKRFSPAGIWRMLRHSRSAREHFRLVQVAPKAGSVVIFRSDMLHGGPDNGSLKSRYIFSISFSRDLMASKLRQMSYSLHSDFARKSLTLEELLGAASTMSPTTPL